MGERQKRGKWRKAFPISALEPPSDHPTIQPMQCDEKSIVEVTRLVSNWDSSYPTCFNHRGISIQFWTESHRLNDNLWRWDIFTGGRRPIFRSRGQIETNSHLPPPPPRSLSGSPPCSQFFTFASPWQLLLIFASSFGRLGGWFAVLALLRVQSFSMRKPAAGGSYKGFHMSGLD